MAERTMVGILHRRVFNSHLQPVTEFEIHLDGDSVGRAASPRGETVSVHEHHYGGASPEWIVAELRRDRLLEVPIDQQRFDQYLKRRCRDFGRSHTLALSVAFFEAASNGTDGRSLSTGRARAGTYPRLCLNILNGGRHAYTNPVRSDFPEFLLVAAHDDLDRVIADHRRIQEAVRQRLLECDRTVVNGNPVYVPGPMGNASCLDLVVELLSDLALADSYALMVDASGGDLWSDGSYQFDVTNAGSAASEAMVEYWLRLIERFGIRFLEDPFHEHDFESWARLTSSQNECLVIGDNLYSSDPDRIRQGAARKYTHGTILKPDQSGTVTAFLDAADVAKNSGQTTISSHRSISTESVFLSTATMEHGIEFMKIGPLLTDYSSIVRLNALIRAAERMR